jgi:hypothetical protein
VWRLWLEGKLHMSEFDHVSLEYVDAANRALDAWQDAEARAIAKAQKGRR